MIRCCSFEMQRNGASRRGLLALPSACPGLKRNVASDRLVGNCSNMGVHAITLGIEALSASNMHRADAGWFEGICSDRSTKSSDDWVSPPAKEYESAV